MRPEDLGIAPLAASFWDRHGDVVTALASVLVALAAAKLVDRAFARRGRALAAAVAGRQLTPATDTRLRFLRRLAFATILGLGLAVALSQFTQLDRLAASLLASGAIAAAIVGFAARQTLANLVAGVMLSITQPLRIGDAVEFEGEAGVVEDVGLSYTWLRAADGRRVAIPNERLAAGVLRNDTIAADRVDVEVSVWIPAEIDADRALAELARPELSVAIAEATPWGVRLSVAAQAPDAGQRASRAAELRGECLRRLRAAGMLPSGAQG